MKPGPVEVWVASTETAGLERLPAIPLTRSESERAGRFHFRRDRDAFVVGRCVLRTVLGRCLGMPADRVPLVMNRSGKPELAGASARSAIGFNLSHSGTLVLFAMAVGRRVGVDIERERESLDVLDIAGRYFCPAETARLRAAPPDDRRRLFFELWALKEAYLKAEGSGLGMDLSAIDVSEVSATSLPTPSLPAEDEPRGIRLRLLSCVSGYQAAVAADGPPWTTSVRFWSSAELR